MSITLDQFKTTTANEYGEAFGLIGLVPDTPAYQLKTANYFFTIGYTDEWDGNSEYVCQIDDNEGGSIACWQGATPQEALENACVEACSIEAMRENPNCEDAVNVMSGEAFAMLHNGNYPDSVEDFEQYDRMMTVAANIVWKCGSAYGIEWSAYRVCDEWAENAANALVSAYADATGESIEDTNPKSRAARNVAIEEVANIHNAATDSDRAMVDDMVEAIAEQAETEAAFKAFEANRAKNIKRYLVKYDDMPYLTLIAR